MHMPNVPIFFAAWRREFGALRRDQVQPIEDLLDFMAADPKLVDLREGAYFLATVHHETARTFLPVEEAYWLSDAWRRKNLRYYPWHGRGFVQLTWERNYQRASRELGVDLISDPRRAMDPEIAYQVLSTGMRDGWFGRPLGQFITDTKSDFKGARRSVNGTDRASAIARLAEQYLIILGCACFADHQGF